MHLARLIWANGTKRPPMKYPVRQFKSLAVALKEIVPFVWHGKHLRSGKPFKKFGGMRSREILANWLVCVALECATGCKWAFTTDPVGGDGLIHDVATGDVYPTEHVMVPRLSLSQKGHTEAVVLQAI